MERILQILPRLRRGGSQAVVMNLYRNLDRSKFQFDFVVFTKDKDDYYDEIINLGGKVYHFTKFNGKNYFKIKKEWKLFLDKHKEYKIIHSHVRSFASIYIPVAKKMGLKTIIHSHSTKSGKGIMGLFRSILQFPLRFQADYLFACSNKAGRFLFGKNCEKRNNYYFLPNGIDLKEFIFNENDRKLIRKKYNIPENAFLLGNVAGFEIPKNHKFLLDVFKDVYERNPNAYLMLVGDGTLENEIRDKCKYLDVSDRVIFTGLQSSVSQYLSAMDLFVFPSLWEGLPVSVVEAEANGLYCLVSSNVTNEVKLVDNFDFLNISDAKIWVNAILNKKMIDRGVNYRLSSELLAYSIDNVVKKLCNFYEEVLKNG